MLASDVSSRCHGNESIDSNTGTDMENSHIDFPVAMNTNGFVVDISSLSVSTEEVSNDNLIMIVNLETTDDECNQLCW